MNVVIFGGTGFIGKALVAHLAEAGHQCSVITRRQYSMATNGNRFVQWDGRTVAEIVPVLADADAIVNLAGETIGKWPWTNAHKQRVINSRVQLGQQISQAFVSGSVPSNKQRVYIQSSGVGFYGDNLQNPIDEKAANGNDFLSQVAREWEASSQALASMPSVRSCVIRTSLVLGRNAGALPMMALPVLLFAGGALGDGNQGVSWIHIQDEVRAIAHLIENPGCEGVFNLSSPQPLSNRQFMRTLAKVLGRPFWLPAPAFLLKLVLGEMSNLLLTGQYAIPAALLASGFTFIYPDLETALGDIYSPKK